MRTRLKAEVSRLFDWSYTAQERSPLPEAPSAKEPSVPDNRQDTSTAASRSQSSRTGIRPWTWLLPGRSIPMGLTNPDLGAGSCGNQS